nr:MAG TPA: hypothetical protein [Caudoviricetes sp.]
MPLRLHIQSIVFVIRREEWESESSPSFYIDKKTNPL